MTTSDRDHRSTYKNMMRGSAWAVALRWTVRAIGLVSVIVLARLLEPEDFGLVAMGALTIGFLRGVTEVGLQMLLIRDRDITREDSDTAWTIKILQGVLVAAALVAVAPLAAIYFNEPRVVRVMQVLALSAIFDGANNIGLVLARKELDFAKDFRFQTYVRVVRFGVTVTLALLWRSYWALVVGRVVATAIGVPLSYWMHSYRPRLSLAKAGHYLRFATAMIPLKVGRYLNNKVDVLVVGGMGASSQLGAYNVASDLSGMLTREILTPLGRGLMPNYAKLNHDPARLAHAYSRVLGVATTIVVPLGIGLWATASEAVPVLLGEKWLSAVPLVQALALYSMLAALLHVMSSQILIVSGHEVRTAMLSWARLALLVPAVIVASRLGDVETVANATVGAALAAFPIVIATLTKSIDITVRTVLGLFWRPLVAAAVMAFVVQWASASIVVGVFTKLVAEVALGGLVYAAALLALWSLAGRPPGLESLTADFVSNKLSRSAT